MRYSLKAKKSLHAFVTIPYIFIDTEKVQHPIKEHSIGTCGKTLTESQKITCVP